MDRRAIQFQENINRRVLLDWVRIVGLPNPRKKKNDSLLEELVRPIPFSWATSAGEHLCQVVRARTTNNFWLHFMQDGRNTLAEYNRRNDLNINICREKILSLQDMEFLGRDEVRPKRLSGPKVTPVKWMLRVGDLVAMKQRIAAIKLNIDMSLWNGVPLLEMLTGKEKEALEQGELKYGSLTFPGMDLAAPRSKEKDQTTSLFNEVENKNTECNSPAFSDKSKRVKIRKRSGNHEEYNYPSKMNKKVLS